MLLSDQNTLYIVVIANGLIYLLLLVGIVRVRSRRIPKNLTVEQAFKILESSLKNSFPDLPEGYTWREVMFRLRALNPEREDWFEIENTFRKYEDYRYGGMEYRNVNAQAVLKLALSLPRGEKFARVSQVKSSG